MSLQQEKKAKQQDTLQQLGVYIHIPFCVRKCLYCDFLSMPAAEVVRDAYVSALCREIEAFENAVRYRPVSIFLGGGTPSLLSAEQIGEILNAVGKTFHLPVRPAEDGRRPACPKEKEELLRRGGLEEEQEGLPRRDCPEGAGRKRGTAESNSARGRAFADGGRIEITMECNPGTLDEGKLIALRRAGVNRLSLGLQSADNRELALLGRIHTWEDFCDTYAAARRAGFDNISVDLMSALPRQTLPGWKNTLEKVLELAPEHISAYSLIIEEGTPFYERYHREEELRRAGQALPGRVLPTEEEERRMYEETGAVLTAAGMYRYEISNYAFPGRESIHNCGYWERREYAGFGLGASSLLGGVRYRNTASLDTYLALYQGDSPREYKEQGSLGEEREALQSGGLEEERGGLSCGDKSKEKEKEKEVQRLTRQDEMEETMFLGLRMAAGVSLEGFACRFGERAERLFAGPIAKYKSLRLLAQKGDRLFLTQEGMLVSNLILSEFLL